MADVRDGRGFYRRLDPATPAARPWRLSFDFGTLLLSAGPSPVDATDGTGTGTGTGTDTDLAVSATPSVETLPAALAGHFVYDPRVDGYRAPACSYPRVLPALRGAPVRNHAPRYRRLRLRPVFHVEPFPHQTQALEAWHAAGGRGLVVLPTGAGKTLVGLQALVRVGRDTLVLTPTIDLMHQWYARLLAMFPEPLPQGGHDDAAGRNGAEAAGGTSGPVGLLGGGYHEIAPLTVATYDSAARHIDRIGNRFGLLVFDEAHHLPAEFYRCIAEFSLAPYRLGLTATPERGDGRDADFPALIGPIVYRRAPEQMSGDVLAPFRVETIGVELAPGERRAYSEAIDLRNAFLREQRISLGSIEGWNRFVMRSAQSAAGRRAMQAHQTARRIARATPAKLRALASVLARHPAQRTVIFTEDNASAYQIAQRFLIPCITHQTRVKERQLIMERFDDGRYRAIVTSKVLNEGIDMPDAAIGVILSGSGSNREFVQRLGRLLRKGSAAGGKAPKQALLYEIVARETRDERVAERRRSPPGGRCGG